MSATGEEEGEDAVSEEEARVNEEEARMIGAANRSIFSWNFDCVTASHDDLASTCARVLRDFLAVPAQSRVTQENAALFVGDIRRDMSTAWVETVPLYHNFGHGADVFLVTMHYVFACAGSTMLTKLETLGLGIAALGHDVGHPGLNNAYQINTQSALALRYSDVAVLEAHSACVVSSMCRDRSLLAGLSDKDCRRVREIVVTSILGTDMASHFKTMERLVAFIENYSAEQPLPGLAISPSLSESVNRRRASTQIVYAVSDESLLQPNVGARQPRVILADDRKFLCDALLHCADVSNPSRPWAICKKWSDLVVEEFCMQGDREQREGIPISPNCNRKTTRQSQLSISFSDHIVMPLFSRVAQILPELKVALYHLGENRSVWVDQKRKHDEEVALLSESPRGLTRSSISRGSSARNLSIDPRRSPRSNTTPGSTPTAATFAATPLLLEEGGLKPSSSSSSSLDSPRLHQATAGGSPANSANSRSGSPHLSTPLGSALSVSSVSSVQHSEKSSSSATPSLRRFSIPPPAPSSSCGSGTSSPKKRRSSILPEDQMRFLSLFATAPPEEDEEEEEEEPIVERHVRLVETDSQQQQQQLTVEDEEDEMMPLPPPDSAYSGFGRGVLSLRDVYRERIRKRRLALIENDTAVKSFIMRHNDISKNWPLDRLNSGGGSNSNLAGSAAPGGGRFFRRQSVKLDVVQNDSGGFRDCLGGGGASNMSMPPHSPRAARRRLLHQQHQTKGHKHRFNNEDAMSPPLGGSSFLCRGIPAVDADESDGPGASPPVCSRFFGSPPLRAEATSVSEGETPSSVRGSASLVSRDDHHHHYISTSMRSQNNQQQQQQKQQSAWGGFACSLEFLRGPVYAAYQTWAVQIVFFVLTLIFLLGHSLRRLCLPPSADLAVDSVLIGVMICFAGEFSLLAVAEIGYACSTIMLVDVLATISLLIDLLSNRDDTLIARMARPTRLIRLLRLVRLGRLLMTYRSKGAVITAATADTASLMNNTANSAVEDSSAESMGYRFVDGAVQRHLLVIIFVLVFYPATMVVHKQPSAQKEILRSLGAMTHDQRVAFVSEDSSDYKSRFDVTYLRIAGFDYVPKRRRRIERNSRRSSESERAEVSYSGPMVDEGPPSKSKVILDVRKRVREEQAAYLRLIALVTALILVTSWLLNSVAERMVARPVSRMLRLVAKAIESLNLLRRDAQQIEASIETDFLEHSIGKISDLLRLGFGAGGIISVENNSKMLTNDNVTSNTVEAAFAFLDVHSLAMCPIEELGTDVVFVYVNLVSHIVRSATRRHGGIEARNTGNSYLLVWRDDPEEAAASDDDDVDGSRDSMMGTVEGHAPLLTIESFKSAISSAPSPKSDVENHYNGVFASKRNSASSTTSQQQTPRKAARRRATCARVTEQTEPGKAANWRGLRESEALSCSSACDCALKAIAMCGLDAAHLNSIGDGRQRQFVSQLLAMDLTPDSEIDTPTMPAGPFGFQLFNLFSDLHRGNSTLNLHEDKKQAAGESSESKRAAQKTAGKVDKFGCAIVFSSGLHHGTALESRAAQNGGSVSFFSPQVNLAAKLESAASTIYGVCMLMSGQFVAKLAPATRQRTRQIDRTKLRGLENPIALHTYDFLPLDLDSRWPEVSAKLRHSELTTLLDAEEPREALDYLAEFQAGLTAYLDGDWTLAYETFQRMSNNNPQLYHDPPTQAIVAFMASNDNKRPSDWRGFRSCS